MATVSHTDLNPNQPDPAAGARGGGRRTFTPSRRTFGRTARWAATTAALTAVAVVTFVPAGAAHAAATWQYWETDGTVCNDSATLDANYNGNYEEIWFDSDNDCKWDIHMFDINRSDWLMEAVTFDMNEDGRPEYWAVDTNQAVGYETLYIDDNGDGRSDRALSLRPATPAPSLFDAINANNGYYAQDISAAAVANANASATVIRGW